MGKDVWNGIIKILMMEHEKIIAFMVKENSHGLMEEFIVEIGNMIKEMEKEK